MKSMEELDKAVEAAMAIANAADANVDELNKVYKSVRSDPERFDAAEAALSQAEAESDKAWDEVDKAQSAVEAAL